MPASWNAGEYRNRATAWLQKAESLPAGRCEVGAPSRSVVRS